MSLKTADQSYLILKKHDSGASARKSQSLRSFLNEFASELTKNSDSLSPTVSMCGEVACYADPSITISNEKSDIPVIQLETSNVITAWTVFPLPH